MEAAVSAGQEEMSATMRDGQENMEAAISAIWSMQTEFVEKISKRVGDLNDEMHD
jgi:cytochrome c556